MSDAPQVPTVLRHAFRLLEVIGDAGPAGIEVSRLQAITGLNLRTVYRHLASLRSLGMVTEARERTLYRLGPAMASMAQATSDQREFMRRAHLVCSEVSERTDESVHVTVYDQGTVVTVAAAEPPQAEPEPSPLIVLGSRRPLHASASGKLFLSFNPSTYEAYRLRPLQRFTEHTITELSALSEECARVRKQGYAEDHEEFMHGVSCVALPVHGVNGRAVGALTVSTPHPRMSATRRSQLLRALRSAAHEFTETIGGHRP